MRKVLLAVPLASLLVLSGCGADDFKQRLTGDGYEVVSVKTDVEREPKKVGSKTIAKGENLYEAETKPVRGCPLEIEQSTKGGSYWVDEVVVPAGQEEVNWPWPTENPTRQQLVERLDKDPVKPFCYNAAKP